MDANTVSEVQWQALLAVAVPYVIQWLKSRPWFPFANFDGGSLNRFFSWFIGAAVGLGIGFSYDASMGRLVITGLSLGAVVSAIQHGGLQIAAQHFVYKAAIAPPLSGQEQSSMRAARPRSFVGLPVGDSSTIFSVRAGDETEVGKIVDVDPRGYFIKRSGSIYEKISEEEVKSAAGIPPTVTPAP